MGRGVLEVHLVDAKGLSGNDFLGKIDPYVIVQYRSQERKSSVARDQGRNPCWNDVFKFQINSSAENAQHELFFRIMDHDNFSSDDFLGEATVNVTDLISLGVERGTWQLNATKYSVVLADKTYHGEIRVGFTFTATKDCEFDSMLMSNVRLKKMERLEAGGTAYVSRGCDQWTSGCFVR